MTGLVSLDTSPFCVFARITSVDNADCLTWDAFGVLAVLSGPSFVGRVGEWLKPADCKSAAPCGLRRFESFPVHQFPVLRGKQRNEKQDTRCWATPRVSVTPRDNRRSDVRKRNGKRRDSRTEIVRRD